MRQVSLREANQNFSSCIAEVESGEHIVVTRRGKPVAEIRPVALDELTATREAARKRLLALMDAGLQLGGKPFTYEERHGR